MVPFREKRKPPTKLVRNLSSSKEAVILYEKAYTTLAPL
jgi:hypothetical protein